MAAKILGRRPDGAFWALFLIGALLVGSLGFFGLAMAAQSSITAEAVILSTDDCPPPADL